MLSDLNGIVTELHLPKLYASPKLTGYANNTHCYKLLPLVANGEYDVLLNIQYASNMTEPNMTTSYLHVNPTISIPTRYPDNETVYARILNFMNSMSYCELFIIITVFIFRCFTNRGKARSRLKVVRVALNNFMSHSVEGSSDRGVSFIYVIFDYVSK